MKMNFRNKLIIYLIPIVFVSIAVLAFCSYQVASTGITSQMIQSMKLTVDKTVDELNSWIRDRKRDVQVFATTNVFRDSCALVEQGTLDDAKKKEAEARLVKYHQLSPIYENVFLADKAGTIFVDAISGKSVGVEIAKIPGYKINIDKAQQGQVWVGDAMASPATGRPVCLVTAPIVADDGHMIGVMGTPVELTAFADEYVSKFKMGESGYVFMMDSTGRTLAHPDKELILKVNLADNDWGKKMIAQKTGILEYQWKGADKITCFAASDQTGWIVATGLTKAELYAQVDRIKYLSFFLGLISIGLISAVLWFISSKVFKVIQQSTNELAVASEQITSASEQVSASSQTLAEGSSEQASSLEETSSALEEMSSMTKQNADHAKLANNMMQNEAAATFRNIAERMEQMHQAIKKTATAGQETSKIIKTIDEIAFQTNLLALNAAVEAARAGDAGKGFAVVASEVRTLAQRATQEAKNTQDLIQHSTQAIKEATDLFAQVSEAMGKNGQLGMKVGELIGEISAASDEQARGVEEINKAISEIDKVTQANASTSEEAAAAAEEMSSQAKQMNDVVRRLLSLVDGGNGKNGSAPSAGNARALAKHSSGYRKLAPGGQTYDPSQDF